MGNLAVALQQLREERTQAQEQVTKLDQAIVAIERIVGKGNSGLVGRGQKGNRTMSITARRKIAAAQRARRAKVKNLKPVLVTTQTTNTRKRTLSPAGRRRIIAA